MPLTVDQVMYGLRMHESGGHYQAQNPDTSASGAYQYTDGTWARYAGYPRARLAPAEVQDRRARADLSGYYARFRDWETVVAYHFYPAWALDRSKWSQRPSAKNPTVAAFVGDVIRRATAAPASPPGTAPAAATGVGAAVLALLALVALKLGVGRRRE